MKYYLLKAVLIAILVTSLFPLAVSYSRPLRPPRPWVRRNARHRALVHEQLHPASKSPEEIRKILREAGGKNVVLENGSSFLLWFPEKWNSLKIKHIIISLHGSGGHAERMFYLWYRNRWYHDYAIIAPQYAQIDENGLMQFMDSRSIYQNLRHIIDYLQKNAYLDNKTVLILHGFSRGAARIFELAALDRASEGMGVFAAFIADSGTSFAENQGRISVFLRGLPLNAYKGGRFWLYSGTGDHEGRTCNDMRKMKRFIIDHGGKVDDMYFYDTKLHGILITGGPRRESAALSALFAYINAIRPL